MIWLAARKLSSEKLTENNANQLGNSMGSNRRPDKQPRRLYRETILLNYAKTFIGVVRKSN
jgi:hypothetical protein